MRLLLSSLETQHQRNYLFTKLVFTMSPLLLRRTAIAVFILYCCFFFLRFTRTIAHVHSFSVFTLQKNSNDDVVNYSSKSEMLTTQNRNDRFFLLRAIRLTELRIVSLTECGVIS